MIVIFIKKKEKKDDIGYLIVSLSKLF